MTRAVVFDLDGTLIDSAPDIHAAVAKMLLEEGQKPLPLTTIISFIGNGLPKLVERVIGATELSINEFDRVTARVLELYEGATSELTVCYPGVIEVLKQLNAQGFVLGLCTNKPQRPAHAILEAFDILELFQFVVGGDTLPVKKPDAAPLLYVKEQLGADDLIYVGDSEVDYATALAAQVPFALFTEGYRKSDLHAFPKALTFGHFSHFPQLLDRFLRAA